MKFNHLNKVIISHFVIHLPVDTLPPQIFNCPSTIRSPTEVGIPNIPVFWVEPFAIDGSGRASVSHRSHTPGQVFSVNNVTEVTYVFVDEAGNRASCSFSVAVIQGLLGYLI